MRRGIKGLLLRTLIVVLVGAAWSFCDDKYDGGSFILSPSKVVFHVKNGDLSYAIPSEGDEYALKRVIQVLNVVQKTQQTKWLTIQRKIALCNEKSCDDTLTIDAREGDSLLVKAVLDGAVHNLVAYGIDQRTKANADQSDVTFKNVSVLLASTFPIWGVVLVGLIGFVKSRKKMSTEVEAECSEKIKKQSRETFMWSAFFGGPIVSYLTHVSEIEKTGKSYFGVVFGICILPYLLAKGICNRIDGFVASKFAIDANYVGFSFYACCLLETLILIGAHLFMALVAANRYEMICPDFDKTAYKRDEVRGVIAGVGFWILLSIVNVFRT